MTYRKGIVQRKMLAKDMKDLADTLRKRNAEQAPAAPVEKPKPPKKPTKAEYRRLLDAHDWDYDQSDDHSVWKKGAEQRKVLVALQVILDPDRVTWRRFEKRHRK